MLAECLYLLRVYLCFQRSCTTPILYCVDTARITREGIHLLPAFLIFLFSLRNFSVTAVKGLLWELEELGCCRASVPVCCQAEQISCVTSRIVVCGFLQ